MDVLNSPVGKILSSFYEFDIPQTPKTRENSVNFDKVIGGDLQPEVRQMLKVASQQRITLIQGLSYADSKPTPRNIIAAVDAYLPNVWKIQKSLEFSKDTKIKIEEPLEFEWSTVLSPSDKAQTFVQGVFIFEVSYVLMIRALAHYNNAREIMRNLKAEMLKEDVIKVLKESMSELRTGAGILEYLTEKLLPNWRKPPENPPPEVDKLVTKALLGYFLCMAQRLYILAALITEKVSVVPRLFGGLQEKYASVVRTIMQVENFQLKVKAILYEEPEVYANVSRVLAMKYKAMTLHNSVTKNEAVVDSMEDTIGTAVGYIRVAQQRAKAFTIQFASMKRRIGTFISEEFKEINGLRKQYENDNATIYFGRVDEEKVLDISRAENVFSLTSKPFEMPDVSALSFEQLPKPEGWNEPIANFNTEKHPNEQITSENVFIPPGVDPEIFKALDVESQQEIVEQYFEEQERKNAAENNDGKKKKKKNKKKK